VVLYNIIPPTPFLHSDFHPISQGIQNTQLTITMLEGSIMILRDLSATNMGRGAYDTTGVKKPGAPPPPTPR
jgi:hypothetical protein